MEIRWHARAGQGAKTAAQLLATALLRSGRSVQAFPEYGPERRGAPVRAYTRFDGRPVRRHDAVETPDVVVVLEPSLLRENDVTAGLKPDGLLLVNGELPPAPVHFEGRTLSIPADRIARAAGLRFANVVMLGALAAVLGEPPLAGLVEAAEELLGEKIDPAALRDALGRGFEAARKEELCIA